MYYTMKQLEKNSCDVDCAKSSNVTTSNEKSNVDTSPTASTNMSTVEDQSSSWGTPFVPSHIKWSQLNDAICTTESDFNVATILSNSSVNINPVVTKNPEVSTNLSESLVKHAMIAMVWCHAVLGSGICCHSASR